MMTPIPVKSMNDFHVVVKFGDGISSDAQGRALLAMEKFLRIELGVPAEVYKETMQDDSKLRLAMTDDRRKSL